VSTSEAGGSPPAGGGAPTGRRRLRREAWGFAIGSLCFLVGALPWYADAVGPVWTAITFLVGSIFFTLAAFIQLSLSGRVQQPTSDLGRADRLDWWAAAVQFGGTIAFNVSTGVALGAAIAQPDLLGAGWRPDAIGSIAFLVSSGLALVATRDRGELWDPDARTWHGSVLGALGSVLFAVSAVGAYVDPVTSTLVNALWANAGTALGAICFLVAAVVSRRAELLVEHEGATPIRS